MTSDSEITVDGRPITLTLTFPESPAVLRASELSRVIASVIYLHDVAAIATGEPWSPPLRIQARGDGSILPGSADRPTMVVTSVAKATSEMPDFRPRFSPRLDRSDSELQIARIGYGSPFWLDLVISSLATAATLASSFIAVEKYLSLPSRVRADRADNDARRAEALARKLKADLEAEATLSALQERRRFGTAEAVLVELESILGPADITEIAYAEEDGPTESAADD